MIAADPMLPAAPHLVGPDATAIVGAAVAAAGGVLARNETVQVQYRPGHDLVVRYDTEVSWQGAPPKPETILAGITAAGPYEGTLPLEAGELLAGVWRYPFDPVLPGLASAVTPHLIDQILEGLVTGPLHLEVLAYRPVRRAVVRVRDDAGRVVYVKVVAPSVLESIVASHDCLRDAGLPVPDVLRADPCSGIVVLSALPGQSLRARLLEATTGWPGATDYQALLAALATVPAGAAPIGDPAHNARSYAAAVAAIVPAERATLDRIVTATDSLAPCDPASAVTIHGDLYEAQLTVQGDRISGLLDLDDVGPGHRLDDVATLLAHLHILQPQTRRHREHLARYRAALRTGLVSPPSLAELDLRTAAVLVGLATGPFRAQSRAWRGEVHRRLAIATRLVASPGERTLRSAS